MSSSSADLVATGIRSDRIGDMWPSLWPLIKPAYEKSREKTDLLAGIRAKDLQAWAICEQNTVVSGIVTRLRPVGTSGHLDCRIWLVGGDRLNSWAPDLIAKLSAWAKAEGCISLSGSGRKGWARIVARFGGERISDEDGQPAWRLIL